MSKETCPFCEIVAGRAPATVIHEWPDVLAIAPLGPVTDGHTLVIPKVHVEDFTVDPVLYGRVSECVARLAHGLDMSWNVITSKGKEATQSVFHLHAHLVPRTENDGLALPWYSGKGKRREH